jgi:hypothetical protein
VAFFLAVQGHDPGFEERLDQRQHPLVLDPSPHPVHQGDVPDFIEARSDVGLQYPAVVAGF